MPATGNNRHNTAVQRLSIQVRLSGLSFLVYDADAKLRASGSFDYELPLSDSKTMHDNLERALCEIPELGKQYPAFDMIYQSEKYTLVPESLFSPEQAASVLQVLFPIDDLEEVNYKTVPRLAAVCVYAIPGVLTAKIARCQSHVNYYTGVLPLLYTVFALKAPSRALLYFFDRKVHLILMQGERLLLLNTYPAGDTKTALYFLFLALRQWRIDAGALQLYLGGTPAGDALRLCALYFPSPAVLSEENLYRSLCELQAED